MARSRLSLTLAGLAALIVIVGIGSRIAFSQGNSSQLTILSTASQNGELAPCG